LIYSDRYVRLFQFRRKPRFILSRSKPIDRPTLFRNKLFFSFIRRFIAPFLAHKFHFRYDSLSRIKGPYLLLSNHNMDIDPILLSLASGHHMYFIATDHVVHTGPIGRFLAYLLNPILITKGKLASSTVMECLKRLRNGHSICIFPEGNRSFNGVTGPIGSGTAKLAQRSGVPLITFRFEGGYLTQPRWSLSTRRGRIYGHLAHVYSTEELSAMSDTELQKKIEADLYENAWDSQKKAKIPFRTKTPALGMDAALYACPKCRAFGSLSSNSHHITCQCGFSASFDTFGELSFSEEPPFSDQTIFGWSLWQKSLLSDRLTANAPIFRDDISLRVFRVPDDHPSSETGYIEGYPDRITVSYGSNQATVTAAEAEGISIFSRNTLTLHLSGGQRLDISGGRDFCGLKYVDLYHLIKKRRIEK